MLSPAFADLFLRALATTLERAGLPEIVRFHDIAGWEVAEFGRPGSEAYISVVLRQPWNDGFARGRGTACRARVRRKHRPYEPHHISVDRAVALDQVQVISRLWRLSWARGDWPAVVTAAIDEAMRQVVLEVLERLLGETSTPVAAPGAT